MERSDWSILRVYVINIYIYISDFYLLPLIVSRSLCLLAKNDLKWNHALRLLFNIQTSDYGATTVAKISLYSTFTRSTVSFD